MLKDLKIALTILILPLITSAKPISIESNIIKKLNIYKKIDSLQANFTQIKKLNKLNIKINSSGSFSFKNRDTIEWIIQKPAFMQISFVRNIMSIKTTNSDGSLQIQKIDISDDSSSKEASSFKVLKSWIKLDAANILKNYNAKLISKNRIELIPKNVKNSIFKKIELTINNLGLVKNLILFERSNDKIHLNFYKYTTVYRKK